MKENSYFIGVKFNQDKTLYKKIVKHELNNSDLIRKSVKLYFRSLEPNSKIFSENDNGKTGFNFGKTGKTDHYNVELVDLLKQQVNYLQDQNDQLIKVNGTLSLNSQSWLSRIIYKLKG